MASPAFYAPTKVCPNCGVQAQTLDDKCPNCGKKYKQKKSHTVRNVLLGITALFVLFVGGCAVLVGTAANEVSNDLEEDANKPGGTDNPLTIVPGTAFEVDGFQYAADWTVGASPFDSIEISNLKVTNNRDDSDSAFVEIKFWQGTEVLGLANCSTEPIDVGTTVTLGCFSADDLPASYDRITISDSF